MIRYQDDGKHKEQSHEGQATLTASSPDWHWSVDLSTYGPNKAHVDMHLRACLDSIIADAQRLRSSLDINSA
jgi:hypothetical protein